MLYMFTGLLKQNKENESFKDKLKKISAAIICVAVLVGGVTLMLSLLF